MTVIKQQLSQILNIKELSEVIENRLIAIGTQGSLEDRFDSREYFWDNLDIITYIAYEAIFNLYVSKMGWTENKLETEIIQMEEELGELVAEHIDFDLLDRDIITMIEEWDMENNDPYGSRGISRDDF